jgi:hypothetical protein
LQIQVYIKFAQDNYKFENAAHTANTNYINSTVVYNAFDYDSGDDSLGKHVICPVSSSFDGNSSCMDNPFKSYRITANLSKNSDDEIEWNLNALIFSSFKVDLDSFYDKPYEFDYSWMFSDPILNSLPSSSSTLKIP